MYNFCRFPVDPVLNSPEHTCSLTSSRSSVRDVLATGAGLSVGGTVAGCPVVSDVRVLVEAVVKVWLLPWQSGVLVLDLSSVIDGHKVPSALSQ